MFQDHQTISALSCFFDAAKVLRKKRQNNPFPTTSPKNPRFWEKSGISWEKVRRRRKRELKSKENKKITPLFPQKSLIFSQRWEKSWESWEKCLIKIKKSTSFTIHEEDAFNKSNQSYPKILFQMLVTLSMYY